MLFLRGFILKPRKKDWRSACLYVIISGNFECFEYFDFETDFLENENLFQKLLVGSTKIENASFPYKTDISKGNVKTNRMTSSKMGLSQRTKFCQ